MFSVQRPLIGRRSMYRAESRTLRFNIGRLEPRPSRHTAPPQTPAFPFIIIFTSRLSWSTAGNRSGVLQHRQWSLSHSRRRRI